MKFLTLLKPPAYSSSRLVLTNDRSSGCCPGSVVLHLRNEEEVRAGRSFKLLRGGSDVCSDQRHCLMDFRSKDKLAPSLFALQHRRRIELEDKAKVAASDWGTESLPR